MRRLSLIVSNAPRIASALCVSASVVGCLLTVGCANKPPPAQTVGLIPSGERSADVRDDRNRLLGVDRAPTVPLDEPFYDIPFTAFGAGIDLAFVQPTYRLYAYFTGDTAATAARQMLDFQSADNRRHGILRLAQESYARTGKPENDLWADLAKRDKDYTVRAAAIRALNWSRSPGHGAIFIEALKDPQPLVRLEAAKALANLPDPAASSALQELVSGDVSRDVRIACVDALRCYKNTESAHALINVLNDSSFDVSWQARQSLRLMTAHDFAYNEQQWLGYLSERAQPFE